MSKLVVPRWRSSEYRPSHHWPWFAGLITVAATTCALAIWAEIWSLLALTLVTTAAYFVLYLARQRIWEYELTHSHLKATYQHWNLRWALAQFRAFSIEQHPGRGVRPVKILVLIPHKRLQPARDVYLPADSRKQRQIFEALSEILPRDDDALRGHHALDRIARVLGIR